MNNPELTREQALELQRNDLIRQNEQLQAELAAALKKIAVCCLLVNQLHVQLAGIICDWQHAN